MTGKVMLRMKPTSAVSALRATMAEGMTKSTETSETDSSSLGPIGLIGVGLLGNAVADRLAHSGMLVVGYDPRPPDPPSASVQWEETATGVFKNTGIVILCLPDSTVASAVIETCAAAIRSGTWILDTTTGSPQQMEQIAVRLRTLGAHYLEMNVAGSSTQISRGEASLLLGANEAVPDRVMAVVQRLSTTHFQLGGVGAASRFKLVHNMILGLNRLALAEGLAFASQLGFDPEQALEILKHTPAASEAMETKGSRMARRRYDPPQARLSQHLKDVRLMMEEAEQTGATIPLTVLHSQLLGEAERMGLGNTDNSAIQEIFYPDRHRPPAT